MLYLNFIVGLFIFILFHGFYSDFQLDYVKILFLFYFFYLMCLLECFILVCIVIIMELVNFLFCVVWMLISFNELGKVFHICLFNIYKECFRSCLCGGGGST